MLDDEVDVSAGQDEQSDVSVVQLSPRIRVRILRPQLLDRKPLPHQRRAVQRLVLVDDERLPLVAVVPPVDDVALPRSFVAAFTEDEYMSGGPIRRPLVAPARVRALGQILEHVFASLQVRTWARRRPNQPSAVAAMKSAMLNQLAFGGAPSRTSYDLVRHAPVRMSSRNGPPVNPSLRPTEL